MGLRTSLEQATLIQDAQKRGDSLETFTNRIKGIYEAEQAESLIQLAEAVLCSDECLDVPPHSEPKRQRQHGKGRPAHRTWTADFLLRPKQSRLELHNWLRNPSIPYQRRRRIIQVVTNSFPCGAFLHKIGKRRSSKCDICRRLRPSWSEAQLGCETVGHIQSAWCAGQAEVVTAAHNRCARLILRRIMQETKDRDGLRLLTADGERTMERLWQHEDLQRLCSWGTVLARTRNARDLRLGAELMPVDDEASATCQTCGQRCHRAARHGDEGVEGRCCTCVRQSEGVSSSAADCDLCWEASLSQQRFDGVLLDLRGKTKRLIIVEFKRRSDTMDNYWLRGKLEAEAQYRDLRQGIQMSLPEGWECVFVPIIAGTLSVGEDAWNDAMATLGIAKGTGQRIRKELVITLLEECDNILRSYYAQLREGAAPPNGPGCQPPPRQA